MERPIILIQKPHVDGIDTECVGAGIVYGRRKGAGVMINVEFILIIVHITELISNGSQGIGKAEASARVVPREAASRGTETTAHGNWCVLKG